MNPSAPLFVPGAAAGVAAPPPLQMMPYGVEIPNRVFVGGCPYNMTEMELSKFFSQFGEVRDTKIITDRDGGKSRGYGFVTFANEQQAAAVCAKGSIYYEQKKLNISKAIRKYGGQFQKANQEYVNGQHLVWMHPNGYLMTQQEGGWQIEQMPSHSQPVKPCYPLMPSGSGGYAFNSVPYTPPYYYTQDYGASSENTQQPTVSVISTITTQSSLESSVESNTSTSQNKEEEDPGMKDLEIKTKQLSLDSAYASEADLDSSHPASNATTTSNSGTASPDVADTKKLSGGSVPSSPSRQKKRDQYSRLYRQVVDYSQTMGHMGGYMHPLGGEYAYGYGYPPVPAATQYVPAMISPPLSPGYHM